MPSWGIHLATAYEVTKKIKIKNKLMNMSYLPEKKIKEYYFKSIEFIVDILSNIDMLS